MSCTGEHARELLATRGRSVADLGLTVGCCETSSFTAVFLMTTGLKPTAYREAAHKAAVSACFSEKPLRGTIRRQPMALTTKGPLQPSPAFDGDGRAAPEEAKMKWNEMHRMQPLTVIGLALAGAVGIVPAVVAQEQGSVAGIVADKVRSQGFPCDKPGSAERVAGESAPNHTVYVLKCEAATYRVVLVPDQAAVVTRIN